MTKQTSPFSDAAREIVAARARHLHDVRQRTIDAHKEVITLVRSVYDGLPKEMSPEAFGCLVTDLGSSLPQSTPNDFLQVAGLNPNILRLWDDWAPGGEQVAATARFLLMSYLRRFADVLVGRVGDAYMSDLQSLSIHHVYGMLGVHLPSGCGVHTKLSELLASENCEEVLATLERHDVRMVSELIEFVPPHERTPGNDLAWMKQTLPQRLRSVLDQSELNHLLGGLRRCGVEFR